MRRLNILFVSQSLHYGGAETVIDSLYRNLDQRIFAARACCLKSLGNVGQSLRDDGFAVDCVEGGGRGVAKYLTALSLAKIIRKNHIDIIHSHCTHSFIDGAICRIIDRSLRHIHTFHYGNYPNYSKRYMVIEKMISGVPDQLISVGKSQMNVLKKIYGIPDARIRTVWNGIIEAKQPVPCRGELEHRIRGTSGETIVIGSIGNLIEQKGYTDLLDVARIVLQKGYDVKFVIAGGGPLESELKAKCEAMGLNGKVEFLGYLERASEVALPAYDIFFMPSLWEAMPVALLEAMAAGKAIVATRVGDIPEMMDHEVTGFLVDRGDTMTMVQSIERFVRDAELRRECGRRARIRQGEHFTVSRMVSAYEDLYLSMEKTERAMFDSRPCDVGQ
ncbi:MAG: glycosyltransferase family 1 protein [Deltaproteobacteria bacterium]|nr:MAG: glycosyltransferase family 1 protein [Deltaproteobacteria bacterium]